MMFAFWYLFSVLTGLILLFSLAREAGCRSVASAGDDPSQGYLSIISSSPGQDNQTNWLILSGLALFVFSYFLWNLCRQSARVRRADWLKIGVTTALVVLPIIFVVALHWKGLQ